MKQAPLNFVISAPRSGSTWLATALNHHPEIFATEHRLLGEFCELWPNNNGSFSPRLTFDSYAEAFSVHYFHSFLSLDRNAFVEQFQQSFAQFIVDFALQRCDKSVVVDKVTPYAGTAELVLEKISRLFPDSKVIELVRDGRDVVTSGTFDWMLKDGRETDRYEFFMNPKRGKVKMLDRFFDDDVLRKWTEHWLEVAPSLMARHQTVSTMETANSPTWTNGESSDSKVCSMVIRYEQMQADMPAALRQVFEFLGVSADKSLCANCAANTTFEKMAGRPAGQANPSAKARKGIVGDWQNYFTRRDGQLFDELAGQKLVELGYAVDHQWWTRLPEKLGLKYG